MKPRPRTTSPRPRPRVDLEPKAKAKYTANWPQGTLKPIGLEDSTSATVALFYEPKVDQKLAKTFSSARLKVEATWWNYEGHPINKLQNGIIQLIFKTWKIRNIAFVHNLIGHIYWNFMMTSLWRHVYIEHSQLVQYFAHSYITCQVLTPMGITSTRKMNAFSNETCLNIKHQYFIFLQFIWTLIDTMVRPYVRRDCCISHQNNTSARSFCHQLHFLIHK